MPAMSERSYREMHLVNFAMMHEKARKYWRGVYPRTQQGSRWKYYRLWQTDGGCYGVAGDYAGSCFGGPENGNSYMSQHATFQVANPRSGMVASPLSPTGIIVSTYTWSDFLGGWLWKGDRNA